MGKGDRARFSLMPSCPGKIRTTILDQDIAGSHKRTYPEWARPFFCIHSPWLMIFDASRVFSSSAVISPEQLDLGNGF